VLGSIDPLTISIILIVIEVIEFVADISAIAMASWTASMMSSSGQQIH
jgi:hypothetical protein